MYTQPSAMEPMLPSHSSALADIALTLSQKAQGLGAPVHPITHAEIARLLAYTNTYYSNLIEGHNTHPVDIERAMQADFSKEPAKRALQLEAKAHMQVQSDIIKRLDEDPDCDIFDVSFITWIHQSFYQDMPAEFLALIHPHTNHAVAIQPGVLRQQDVQVGRHTPPAYGALPSFLQRFHEKYNLQHLHGTQKIIAVAASHHRFAWIHPFLDGNGRVTRLLSFAALKQLNLDAHGLWSISRGLARHRTEYYMALANADSSRRSDLDGRGNLSAQGLEQFCKFFLNVALDQIEFMHTLLDLTGLNKRIEYYLTLCQQHAVPNTKPIRLEAKYLLQDILLRGEIARGEVARITGLKERTARTLIQDLLQAQLIQSNSPRGALRICMPVQVGEYYFPRLYPKD